jgi:peptide/nickel transport system substrate-binding protein
VQQSQHSYWQKLQRARLSRRRFLGGAVVTGLGAAGLAAAGCAEEEEEGVAVPTPETTPAAYERCTTPGGWTRGFGWDPISLDTYDPHQTQFGPMYTMHGAVFSKVLNYEDDVNQVMYPDLSAGPDGGPGMPEQVDEETYIIRVRPTAKFHDTEEIRKDFPEVAGRAVTAEDIKYSIERQVNPDSPQRALYYRRGLWETVDKIELIDDLTLRITTKGPIAAFINYLADRNAAIIAKELVDENDEMNHPDKMIGSGPFILDELKALQHVKISRNPEWFAADDRPDLGTGRPFLDGYISPWPVESAQMEETAFKTKQVDAGAFGDGAVLARIAREMAGQAYLYEPPGQAGGPQSRFLIDRPPFDDFRRRKAIHLAVDRQIFGEMFFPSVPEITRWFPSGPINWPMKRWALPQDELATFPGYRFGAAEREEDLREARALWDAAGGTEAAGKFKLISSNVPDYVANKGQPQMVRMLKEVLGAEMETEVDPTGYTIIASCMLANTRGDPTGTCEFLLNYDNGWIDPDEWLYLFLHTGAPKNSYGLSDPKLDEMLEEQRAEFDHEKRRGLVLDIQRYFLNEVLAHLQYVSEWNWSLHWNYSKNRHEGTWFGHAYWYANMWLDQNDPTFQGRPA